MTMCIENVLKLKLIVKVDDLSILPQKSVKTIETGDLDYMK